jgi:hypothetical protein
MKKALLYTIIFVSSSPLSIFASASAAANSADPAAKEKDAAALKEAALEQAENEYYTAYEALVNKENSNNWVHPQLPTLKSLKRHNIPHLSDAVIANVFGMFATTKKVLAIDIDHIKEQLENAKKEDPYDVVIIPRLEENLRDAEHYKTFAPLALKLAEEAPKMREAWIKQRTQAILSGQSIILK